VRSVIDSIRELATKINRHELYFSRGKAEDAYFWENYYALDTLKLFKEVYEKHTHLEEMKYMIINPVIFPDTNYEKTSRKVSVIMPFSEEWTSAVYRTFCEAIPEYGLWCSRDRIASDAIMASVWENINSCEFVIADCTNKNANVFYELGIAHTLGKPVFLCAQSADDIPFDIRHLRYFVYENSMSEKALEDLKKAVQLFAAELGK